MPEAEEKNVIDIDTSGPGAEIELPEEKNDKVIDQPTEKEIDEAIGSIREIFKKPIKVLYGGSVKASNAQILLDNTDINGLLVGGASLNAQEFAKIAQLC